MAGRQNAEISACNNKNLENYNYHYFTINTAGEKKIKDCKQSMQEEKERKQGEIIKS